MMPQNMKPPDHGRAFYDRTSVHDSPHGSDMDTTYRHATDALIWRMSGATRTWVWPYVPVDELPSRRPAPLAIISAIDTWSLFYMDTFDVGLPWRFTEGCERILVYAWIMCQNELPLKFRVDVDNLVSGDVYPVTPTTGETNAPTNTATREPDTWRWWARDRRAYGNYGLGIWQGFVAPSSLPANRRCRLVPYVKHPDEYAVSSAMYNVGGTLNVWLSAMVVMDMPPKDTIGW